MEQKVMVTIKQAMEKTGLSRSFILTLIHDNAIPCFKAGNRNYINYNSLIEYLSKKETGDCNDFQA